MSDGAFKRDLKALRHDLGELQERLEDLGESSSDAAKSALNEMKGKLESRLAHVFSSVREGGGGAEAVGKGVAKASEYGGKRLLKKAEGRAKGAFHEATHDDDHDRGVLSAASIAVFGLGFAVGWLVARRLVEVDRGRPYSGLLF